MPSLEKHQEYARSLLLFALPWELTTLIFLKITIPTLNDLIVRDYMNLEISIISRGIGG